MPIEIFSYVAFAMIGIAAGILAGLLGISGGVITVPLLFLVFKHSDLPQAYVMHIAIGTSLAAMVFNALSSTWSHHRRHAVLWSVIKCMAPGIVVGSILGALVANLLSGVILEMIFGLFACLLGLHFLRKHTPHEGAHALPGKWALSAMGVGIAALSNILGIGGGIITVPTLTAFKVPEKKAIATSAASGLIISFFGAVAYLYFGLHEVSFPMGIGFLYLPAFIVISITTFFAAPYGAKWAHTLPSPVLRKIFAVALLLTGISMVVA